MVKDNPERLNSFIFEQLENLSDSDDMLENGKVRIAVAKQVAGLVNVAVANNAQALRVEEYKAKYGLLDEELPKVLQNE